MEVNASNFSAIPCELKCYIFTFLTDSIQHTAKASLVCKEWYDLLTDALWRIPEHHSFSLSKNLAPKERCLAHFKG